MSLFFEDYSILIGKTNSALYMNTIADAQLWGSQFWWNSVNFGKKYKMIGYCDDIGAIKCEIVQI